MSSKPREAKVRRFWLSDFKSLGRTPQQAIVYFITSFRISHPERFMKSRMGTGTVLLYH